MKTIFTYLLPLGLLFTGITAGQAQSQDKIDGPKNQTEEDSPNLVKVNLTAIPLKNFSFQYERALTRKISGAVSLRVMPKGGLPLKSLLEDVIDDEEAWRHIDQIKISNFAITPEIRFYMGKSVFKGFYIAPFARFATYSVDMPFEFDVDIQNPNNPNEFFAYRTETIPLNGRVSSITGGILFGAQWKVAKKVYLDWWILGPHFGTATGDIKGNKILTQEEQDALRDGLSDLEDLPFIDGSPEVNANGARVNVKGPWGGVRAGLSIGYRF